MKTSQQKATKFLSAETVSRRFAKVLTLTLAAMIVVSLGASAALAQVPLLYGPL